MLCKGVRQALLYLKPGMVQQIGYAVPRVYLHILHGCGFMRDCAGFGFSNIQDDCLSRAGTVLANKHRHCKGRIM